jgi:hypothetical protein
MTPEERNLVSELFDRLATLEDAARDPEAERLIKDGLRQAPNAIYALVQSVLVQDEALKRADARIGALEDELSIGREPTRQPGVLDSMRDALFGSHESDRQPAATGAPRSGAGSVPSVRPADATAMATPPPRGGSFLGTAASAAAGVIGGSLLLDGIRSMMGQPHGAQAAFNPAIGGSTPAAAPDPNAANSDLARQAGINDIGRDTSDRSNDHAQGLFGEPSNDDDNDASNDDDDMSNDDGDMDDDDFDDDDGGFDDDN